MKTFWITLVAVASLAGVRQQAPAVPYAPKQSDRPEAVVGDEPGFQPIFDGQTLSGWEGDPTYWRVENGALVGEITPATVDQEQHVHHLARRPAEGLRAQARLPHHARGQQRHQLSQRRRPRPRHPGEQIRDARLPVRPRRQKALPGQQLRREGPPVPRRSRSAHAHRRRPPTRAGVDDRRSRRARQSGDRRLECRPPDRSRQYADAHHQPAGS